MASKEEELAKVKEALARHKLLQDWPYARAELLNTPEGEVIEQHARHWLGRALNIGKVIAMVGSGVSMNYGRPGWGDLLRMERERLEADVAWLASRGIEDARVTFRKQLLDKLEVGKGGALHAARAPTIFQLCEQLDRAIEDVWPHADDPVRRPSFRQRIKAATRDDYMHTRMLLREALMCRDGALVKDGALTPDEADETCNDLFGESIEAYAARVAERRGHRALRYDYQTAFQAPFIQTLAAEVEAQTALDHLARAARKIMQRREAEGSDSLVVVHRFLVGALLRQLPANRRKVLLGQCRKDGAEPSPRSAVLPVERDPLRIMRRDLRLNRFLTTNYDLDVEQLMEDDGFVASMESDDLAAGEGQPSPSADALGTRFNDLVFTPEECAKLIAFATMDDRHSVELVHLHGRAGSPKPIVVTEGDYQQLYRGESRQRAALDQALDLTFSANAMLFVGNGMGEEDLLRPFFEFMGRRERLGARLAVALMPNLDAKGAATAEDKALMLGRYGVYTIHFGSAKPQGGDDDPSWMARAHRAAKLLAARFGAAGKDGVVHQLWVPVSGDAYADPAEAERELAYLGRTLQSVEGDENLLPVSELALLGACSEAWREVRGMPALDAETRRAALGFQAAALGAANALLSLFLSAALRRMHRDWERWRNAWLRPPARRRTVPPDPQPLEDPPSRHSPKVAALYDSRHAIHLENRRSLAKPALRKHRFYVGAASQAAIKLREALRDVPPEVWSAHRGRRIFAFIVRRGVGKGHFFAAFADQKRTEMFREACWAGCEDQPDYFARGYFNLSFSLEVGSVFERIAELLDKSFDGMFDLSDAEREDQAMQRATFAKRSSERLAFLLRTYARFADRAKGRALIAINGLGILFEADGLPKSAQNLQMFEAMIGEHGAQAPIDFVFTLYERTIPIQFRAGGCVSDDMRPQPCTQLSFAHVIGPTVAGLKRDDIRRRLAACDIAAAEVHAQYRAADGAGDAIARRPLNIVHVLRNAGGVVIAPSFFPATALALAWKAIVKEEADRRLPELASALSADLLEKLHFEAQAVVDDKRYEFTEAMSRILLAHVRRISPSAASADEDAWRAIDSTFKRMVGDLGRGRFTLTVILGAADAILESRMHGEQEVERALRDMFAFVAETRRAVSASSDQYRAELVLGRVFEKYLELDAIDCPDVAYSTPIKDAYGKDPGRFHRLQQQILWHLAVIGRPVEACVLVGCPGIAEQFRAGDDYEKRLAVVEATLEVLVHRCLVFQLRSRPHARDPHPFDQRYAVHRQLQRYVFRRMNTPFVEYQDVDPFTVSLYASQPNDLPHPNGHALERLRILVGSLSRYPESRYRDSAPHGDEALDVIRVEALRLRAAYGVLRNVYSAALVARFDKVAQPTGDPRFPHGYFEEHRRRIRWLLTRAAMLGDQAPDGAIRREAPFYAEEISWLFNECGVLSLMQGEQQDASSLFGLARRVAQTDIEGGPHGPIAARIGLNKAVADIERGAPRGAREELRRVSENRGEHPAIRWIADGYLAFINHLAGRLDEAEPVYNDVIHKLANRRHTRAASIFSRHLTDLYRIRGGAYRSEAENAIRNALNYASDGVHEDVMHQARLAQVQLQASIDTQRPLARFREAIDEAERYADVMGVPRIKIETMLLRSALLVRQGETLLAGELAVRATALSHLHGLKLRKIQAMMLLGGIFERSGNGREGRITVQHAADLAHEAEYNIARTSTNSILEGVA